MKDWCMKHPWMTFFLIDWTVCSIANAIVGRRTKTALDQTVELANDFAEGVISKLDAAKKEERTIGFKAS